MRNVITGIVFGTIVLLAILVVVGSMSPPETAEQRFDRFKTACASEHDPDQCLLREAMLSADKMQENHQREVDREAGN